jgi:Winged helix DNA-binding domain
VDGLDLVRRRMWVQGLTGKPFRKPVDAVRSLGAVQAQEFAEAKWSLAERVRGDDDSAVERAFADGEILRTHALRPTWHFVRAKDIRWILSLTGPRVHAANGHPYRRFDLDDALLARTDGLLYDTLADGQPRTRKELGGALADAGIPDASGARLAYIVMHAELEAVICSGPRRGAQHTYLLVEQRAPDATELDHDEALAELTRRYFAGHGPATVRDYAWWSGLKLADARAGIALADLEEIDDGYLGTAADVSGDPGRGGAFLIPMYDESTIAFKEHRVVLAAEPPRKGLLQRPVVIDGVTFGSWKRVAAQDRVTVRVTLFARLGAAERRAVEEAVDRFGAFAGVPARLETCSLPSARISARR